MKLQLEQVDVDALKAGGGVVTIRLKAHFFKDGKAYAVGDGWLVLAKIEGLGDEIAKQVIDNYEKD